MRNRCFELSVKAQGVELNEEEIDGKTFVIAQPETEYRVEVKILADKLDEENVEWMKLEVKLKIDGNFVGCKFYDIGRQGSYQTFVFSGFHCDGGVRAFQFSPINSSSTENSENQGEILKIGKIEVTVRRMTGDDNFIRKDRICGNQQHLTEEHGLNDQKKFWEQASVATKGGRIIPMASKLTKYNWVSVDEQAVKMVLYYHTQDIINILKANVSVSNDIGGSVGNKRKVEISNTSSCASVATGNAATAACDNDYNDDVQLMEPAPKTPAEVVDLREVSAAKRSRSCEKETVDLTAAFDAEDNGIIV